MLDSLDAAAVAAGAPPAWTALRRHQYEIDELNVYPVPDGDTGTNLVLTVSVGLAGAVRRAETPADLATDDRLAGLRCMARGALLGARGQLRRDRLAVAARHGRRAGRRARRPAAGRWRTALTAAATRPAYAAVAEPVEGTVLSVATRRGRRRHRRPTPTTSPRWCGPPPRARPRRWPVPPSSCRCWPGPASSTPAAGAWSCCSTRWSRSSTGPGAAADGAAGPGGPRPRAADGHPRDRLGRVRLRGAVPARRRTTTAVEALRATLAGLGDSLVVVGSGAPA